MSEFCLPTVANAVAAGPDWLHEIKMDGYRLRIERDGNRVRLITRGGYNSTRRYPWIVEGARKVRRNRFVIDDEAVVLGVDGISDFNALHSGKHNREVQLCAFDLFIEGGEAKLDRLLARRPDGIFLSDFEHLRQAFSNRFAKSFARH